MKPCRTCNQSQPLEAYRGTRSMCLACERARRREWYAAQTVKPHQREEMKSYYRQWYASNAESVKARAVEWAKANPDKRRDVCRENMARQRGKLSDAYVRRMLAKSVGLKAEAIPQPLVEAQRELLKIKRYIREHSI
ncbi:MAG: hypothetical protein ACK40S_02940 [Burkholderiaceae bacterium]